MARNSLRPTVPDLVVLSLLTERPRHGYELNQELIRREVKDWAGISRPQVYYSLKKLLQRGWVQRVVTDLPSAGPEKQVVEPTAAGLAVLQQALGEPHWAQHRPVPPFATWLALSRHASHDQRLHCIELRRHHLQDELDKERQTLAAIKAESGPMTQTAMLMIELVIRQFEVELFWLDEVQAVLLP
ncbi:MAG: PadR family transcriptional regulator [Proteobacteria bacterium]|jgi:DNA-binding PadR family transcriptional regulator|nr:PadR family transcriptional regulator [Pseudomonadota bacterium]